MKKVALTMLSVNLQQGFLVDGTSIYGAYSHNKKELTIHEQWRFSDFELPVSLLGYRKNVERAGHFTIGYWSMVEGKEVRL